MDKATDKHRKALQDYKRALDYDRENREAALDDSAFVAGEQWPDDLLAARANRPCMTVNRLPSFIRQVANEIRIKPPAIQVVAMEDADRDLADVQEGLIRSIEAVSSARRAYASAIEDSTRCGMGFLRVMTDYATEDSFDQEARIRHIDNPMSVLMDPDMVDPLGSDAKFAFVLDTMSEQAFREAYPDKSSGMDGDATTEMQSREGWLSDNRVQIAEYWCVEETPVDVLLLEDGTVVDVSEYDAMVEAYNQDADAFQLVATEAQAEAATTGAEPELPDPPQAPPLPAYNADGTPRTRKVKRRKVMSYLMSGGEFLEGPTEWVGSRIPIVPVWGEVYRIGDRTVRTSLIRFAKDSQRMINFWRSASVEALALAPRAPVLITAQQVKGHELDWANAGLDNPAVLVYNETGSGVPTRLMPPTMQAAMFNEAAVAQDDLKATTGIYDAALGARSNETSGKAIMARQREGDISTYAFIDNLMQAVEEIGRILVNIIPRVYDAQRQIRILGPRMETKVLTVNDGGQYDLTRGKYDVVVKAGGAFTTRREEMAEIFQGLMQSVPALAPVIIPRLIDVLDMPDAEEIAQEVRALTGQGQQKQAAPDPKGLAQAAKYEAEARQTNFETDLATARIQSAQNMAGYPVTAMPPNMGG